LLGFAVLAGWVLATITGSASVASRATPARRAAAGAAATAAARPNIVFILTDDL
jgi:hypothetical protein